MQKLLESLAKAVNVWQSGESPVAKVSTAKKLESIIDVSLSENGCNDEELQQSITDYLEHSPNSAHPEYFKLLYSGINKPALLGDWITSLSNSTMHTYQVGPVATLMELELIKQWNNLIGFNQGEGVMVSGGSQANLVGMMLARHRACPSFKHSGYQAMRGKKLIAYTSDQAHYSNQRSVNALGIGSDNLISVKTDNAGCIDPDALEAVIEKDIAEGHQPFYLGLTAGTTVVGAFDSIVECHAIAKKHNIWLHIDGAWGGPVLFSKKYKHLLSGSELADSFAWDAHKFMNVPITAAVILVKEKGLLSNCIAGGGGDYLFHQDENAEYNLGERSLQCGRRADCLKVWLSWKAVGSLGFAEKLETMMGLIEASLALIEERSCFELLAPANYLNILFRFRAENLTGEQLDAVNVQICKAMLEEGGPYVDHARYKGRVGIRLILANPSTNISHVKKLLDHSEALGKKLHNASH